MKVTKRCACRGDITADPEAPGPDVLMHNRSPQHVAWRMGYRVDKVPQGLLTPDGLPITRLARVP